MNNCYKLTYTEGGETSPMEYYTPKFKDDYFRTDYYICSFLMTTDNTIIIDDLTSYIDRMIICEFEYDSNVTPLRLADQIKPHLEHLVNLGDFCEFPLLRGIFRAELAELPKLDKEKCIHESSWSLVDRAHVYINGERVLKNRTHYNDYWHFDSVNGYLDNVLGDVFLKLIKKTHPSILDIKFEPNVGADTSSYIFEFTATSLDAILEMLKDIFECNIEDPNDIIPICKYGSNGKVEKVVYRFYMHDCAYVW